MTGSGDIWRAERPLPEHCRNLALMHAQNAARFRDQPCYQEPREGKYEVLSWGQFHAQMLSVQSVLRQKGLELRDRVAIVSRNRQEMLVLEQAVMAYGAIAVPIFAGYAPDRTSALVNFCQPRFVAVSDQEQYDKLANPREFKAVIHIDPLHDTAGASLMPFSDLLSGSGDRDEAAGTDIPADAVALMMYTSGTMGKPKCVQLTHSNILSQQAAMRVLWNLSSRDRLLSYLPWHHSFGGIFEKYAALTNGAVLSLEDGYGKDVDRLLDNWRQVRPTIFFSVPRIYQEVATRVVQSADVERLIFHDELRFIFTAAAPLPKNISDMFEQRGVPVIEGWGLTETSPCCTVTDPDQPREPGVVGKPIPGVMIRIAEDGEILVKGANVMTGYYKNPETNQRALPPDGWFYTGDVGEFTAKGLRIISRKDRIFKLSNAEKVIPSEIEDLIIKDCAYLSHAYVAGSGKDHPVALLFPNEAMFSQMPDESRLKERCRSPRSLEQLSTCLDTCLRRLNNAFQTRYYRLESAMLVDRTLSIENDELTPSMKLAPNVIASVFKANIEQLCGSDGPLPDKVYIIRLD